MGMIIFFYAHRYSICAPCPPNPNLLSNRVVVVIDVLRATSVMAHAMSQGALEIIPVATVEEAFQMAKVFPRGSIILGGERESKNIPGFDLGNSPTEYVAERVRGKKFILTTTNGTKAFHWFHLERNFWQELFLTSEPQHRNVLN